MKKLKIAFDHSNPNINHSEYPIATHAWVDGIRKSFPHVWNLGSSELSDDAFELWSEYAKGREDENTQKFIRRRENYAAKHANDANFLLSEKISPRNAYPLINLLKWGITPPFGLRKAQELISDLLDCDWSNTAIRFEKMYGDYPDSAVDNASRALSNKDTQAGNRNVSDFAWEICEKIAKRQKLTFTEIQKVASFIQYKELAKLDYADDPSALNWLAMGGTNGIMWAKRRADSMGKALELPTKKAKAAEDCSNETCGSCLLQKKGWCEQYNTPVIKGYVCDQWVDNEEARDDAPLMGMNSKARKGAQKRHMKSVALNRACLVKARKLIPQGDTGSGSEQSKARYIEEHGWDEFAKWHLATNKTHGTRSYTRYMYPITKDFKGLSIEQIRKSKVSAAINGHKDVFVEAAKLISELEAKKPEEKKQVKTTTETQKMAILTKAEPSFDTITNENGAVVDYQNVRIAGYASTNEDTTKADRGGDYIHKGAFRKTIPNFMKNPVMLSDHTNSTKSIVGKYTSLREDGNGLFIEGELSNSPEAKHMRFQVAEGNLKTMSIGGMFHYDNDGKGIHEVDLMEISLVAIPMNPDAIFEVRSFDSVNAKS